MENMSNYLIGTGWGTTEQIKRGTQMTLSTDRLKEIKRLAERTGKLCDREILKIEEEAQKAATNKKNMPKSGHRFHVGCYYCTTGIEVCPKCCYFNSDWGKADYNPFHNVLPTRKSEIKRIWGNFWSRRYI